MKKKIKIGLLIAATVITLWLGYEYFIVDACYDHGGIWDYKSQKCIEERKE